MYINICMYVYLKIYIYLDVYMYICTCALNQFVHLSYLHGHGFSILKHLFSNLSFLCLKLFSGTLEKLR